MSEANVYAMMVLTVLLAIISAALEPEYSFIPFVACCVLIVTMALYTVGLIRSETGFDEELKATLIKSKVIVFEKDGTRILTDSTYESVYNKITN